MSIDTAEKRKAIVGIHLYANGTGVTPNAAQDIEWRYESGYSYPFDLAGAGVTVTPGTATLVLTGYAPTVLTPQTFTPITASLVLTGYAPDVAVSSGAVGSSDSAVRLFRAVRSGEINLLATTSLEAIRVARILGHIRLRASTSMNAVPGETTWSYEQEEEEFLKLWLEQGGNMDE